MRSKITKLPTYPITQLPNFLMHRARTLYVRRRILPLFEKSNHAQQLHRLVGRSLESPLAVIERSILKQERATPIENAALTQDTVYKPAFFQLKHLVGKCPSLVFCDRHIAQIIRPDGKLGR
jgi:hypothetical protein